ncbi:carboxylesterase/lipase family protein [Maribacter confluentis]|uniref:Carboxylic ester hydrolase n=1 Tax=Maribacter confluentis TaxID=1656093 RepID=A0ABT8RMU5_9FLAO|nr:carboxylesterase/lipase family protein [Maribacter confluentis]MDO1512242.1 carboxylesterase/lipase family protein [Maribacter confluentis]
MKIPFYHLLTLALCMMTGIASAQDIVITGSKVPVIETENGPVRGYIHDNVHTFKGIPYAQANRFEAATNPTKWDAVRSTTMYGPVSPLINPTTTIQDESEFVFDHDWGFPNEDCLSLNVWSPNVSDGKTRPVLFWIHGGGFTAGSSHELPSYDGENLAKNGDVVVVSINHRLNVLGFLDLSAYGDKYAQSANNSIMDMVKALEWVKNNIANFGGDPNNVTIFGQSGGGAKVSTLMAMPKAKGLFHKAINQSGSFRTAMLEKEDTQAIAKETLTILGLNANTVDSIQHIPFETLASASSQALKIVAEQMRAAGKPVIGFGLNWGPSKDGNVLPYQLGTKEALAVSKDIPFMIGTAKNEFAPFANMRFVGVSEETIMAHIKETYKDKADAYIGAVKKAYPKDTDPKDLLDVDTMFRPGAVMEANDKSALNGAPVYMYLFTWQSPVFDGKYKALHCMELPFVFDNIDLANHMTGGGEEAHKLAKKMSKAWINFARTGNPNHDGLPEWPAYNSKNTATMHFDTTCEVKPQLDKELFEIVRNK